MIAVIFEVHLTSLGQARYLELAAALRSDLDEIDGFLSVERFQSISMPGKILSLSFWRDEDALAAWRGQAEHRLAQMEGRNGAFADYRLRVACVTRDYGLTDRAQAPED